MKEFKHFFRDLLLVGILVLAIYSPILFFNTVVDPYGVFFQAFKDLNLEPNNHFQKIKYLVNHPKQYDSFIFGSSRVNYINPQKIPKQKFYNMTYASGLPKAHYEDLLVMIDNDVSIKNLVIGIDYMSLIENPEIKDNDLLRKKYPVSIFEKIKFYKAYLFNMPGWDFMKLAFQRGYIDRSKVDEYGITTLPDADKFIDSNPNYHLAKEILQIPISYVPKDLDIDKNIEEIEKIIELSNTYNIDLTFFINPIQTATYLNMDFEKYFTALQKLSEITAFYDFSGLTSAVTDQTNFYESSHYRSTLGDLIIAEIFKTADTVMLPTDFCFYTTHQNIDQNISRHIQLLNRFTEATSPSVNYTSSIADSTDLNKTTTNFTFDVKYINKKRYYYSDKAINITTPALNISGYSKPNTDNMNLTSFLKIGDKYFSVKLKKEEDINFEQTKNQKENLLMNWDICIPKSLLKEGHQEINWVFYDAVNHQMYVSEKSVKLNIIRAFKPVLLNKLKLSEEEIKFSIDYINGLPASQFKSVFDEKTLQITGWSFSTKDYLPSAAVIFSIDSCFYRSQYIIKRQDVANIYNHPQLINSGWGINIPIESLKEGEHKLRIQFVNSDTSAITQNEISYTFNKINIKTEQIPEELAKIPFETDYSIDIINSYMVNNKSREIQITDNYLKIIGWAVDKASKELASEVILKIDSLNYKATIGFQRPDVAEVFKNPSYINSGWEFNAPISMFEKGDHELSVIVISSDKKSYYSTSRSVRFKIN